MNLDLFASPKPADPQEYLNAFAAWQKAHTKDGTMREESSAEVYAHMWAAFSTWCVSKELGMDKIAAADLQAYLAARGGTDELSARYAWRLLHLIDRVLAHRSRQQQLPVNKSVAAVLEARPDIRFANAAKTDPLPDYLEAGAARRLVAFLSSARPGRSSPGLQWQTVRNRTAVALMLGAGLTPSDVRGLDLESVIVAGGRVKDVPWKLRLPGNGNSPGRETPVAAWAGQLLRYWLEVRLSAGVQGNMAFPSTRTGKPWGKVSHYNATKEVLAEAGIEEVEGGSYRLRHTFVLRQLRRKTDPEQVARWIGVSDPAVMARYLRVINGPVEVV